MRRDDASSRIGLLIFLAADTMLFAALLFSFLVLHLDRLGLRPHLLGVGGVVPTLLLVASALLAVRGRAWTAIALATLFLMGVAAHSMRVLAFPPSLGAWLLVFHGLVGLQTLGAVVALSFGRPAARLLAFLAAVRLALTAFASLPW